VELRILNIQIYSFDYLSSEMLPFSYASCPAFDQF
jgi:hypothetical protein